MSSATHNLVLVVDMLSYEIRRQLLPRLSSSTALALLEDLIEGYQLEFAVPDDFTNVDIEEISALVQHILEEQLETRSPAAFLKYVRGAFGLLDRCWHYRQIRSDFRALEEFCAAIEYSLEAFGARPGHSARSYQ